MIPGRCCLQRINSLLGSIPFSPTLHINEMVREMREKGQHVFHFGFGQSPFPVPDVMVQALQENACEKDYLPARGLFPLREAIASHLEREFQLDHFQAENVCIGPGSKQLLYQMFLAFHGEIILPSPSWVSYYPQCLLAGKTVHRVATSAETNWHITAESLEEICASSSKSKMLLLNSPCNPTGQTYTRQELDDLVLVFRKHDLIVIADEIYALLKNDGNHVSIASVYPEKTILFSGISKAFGAGGWRLGFSAFPPMLADFLYPMDCLASETFSASCAPVQYASIEAFKENTEIHNLLGKQRRILSGVGKYVQKTLCNEGVSVLEAQGGFYLFPDFEAFRAKLKHHNVMDSTSLSQTILRQAQVATLPGCAFSMNPSSLTVRLAFVNFDGRKALSALEKEDCSPCEPVSESFVKKFCPDTVAGAEQISSWLHSL